MAVAGRGDEKEETCCVGLGRLAILTSLADGPKHGYALDSGHQEFLRSAAGTRNALRGA